MSWAVVIPTIRPDKFDTFLEAWYPLFNEHDVQVIVVWDLPEVPKRKVYDSYLKIRGNQEWCHSDIPPFIPRQTDMIRSWGFYQAWRGEADFVLSLDDDVLPTHDIFAAYEHYFLKPQPLDSYLHVGALTTTEKEMRGYPYKGRRREVAVQYGGWHGVPDLGAVEQLAFGVDGDDSFHGVVMPVPKGVAATCCAMNFAFRWNYAPIMWQLPLYKGRYNRFGDIWSGLLQKRTLDALDKVMLINGRASILHDRASDPFKNMEREAPGLAPNEELWAFTRPTDDEYEGDMLSVYRAVTNNFLWDMEMLDPTYAQNFRRAREKWLALFS